jgi:lipopolysaccharide biosynthesis protein
MNIQGITSKKMISNHLVQDEELDIAIKVTRLALQKPLTLNIQSMLENFKFKYFDGSKIKMVIDSINHEELDFAVKIRFGNKIDC